MVRSIVALLMLFLLLARPALALESAPVATSRATATLITDTDAIAPNTPFRVALRLRLAPGWHTYWSNPGDAGVAPEITLHLPKDASSGPVQWPAPQRIAEGPLMTYAYTGQVILPMAVTPGAAPIHIQADATWLVCKEICVPEQGSFAIDVPAGTPAASAQAGLFAEADRQLPKPSPWTATITDDGRLWIHGSGLDPAAVAHAWFIPQTSGLMNDAGPQPLTKSPGSITLALPVPAGFKAAPGISGVLLIQDRAGQTAALQLAASPGPAPAPPSYRILWLAFLGGLILNLMPCVFPVLAVKALSFVEGAARGKGAGHAAAYCIGVLSAFAGLGAAMLLLREAGSAAGWGFQFQSPTFVAGMSWLLLAIGLNLSGVFQLGASLAGAGHGLAQRSGQLGSFFTGLLAVVVATPCTAPFMGAAIAGGLAGPPLLTMLVFLAMGVGLAAPYAVLVAVPGLAAAMPRPGRWMELLRQALAFPIYAAAAWMFWVLSQQVGPAGLLGGLAGALLIALGAWALGAAQSSGRSGQRLGESVAAASALAAIVILTVIGRAPAAPMASDPQAEPFTAARLASLRQEGRPVFVDMTAAWCITCQVNERVAIDAPAVQQAFALHHVAYLRGDWTREDPAITAFLREHGHDGVPLYVYFPPAETPVVLPQILTPAAILSQVGGPKNG